MLVLLLLACTGSAPTPEAPPAEPEPAAAPAPEPKAEAPVFAKLTEERVMGAGCYYDYADGSGLSGRAFEHDGDETWLGLATGDVRLTRDPADGSFGGESEAFTFDGGQVVVSHTDARIELTRDGKTSTIAVTGGCGD